jgi:hypothetical protein
VLLLVGIPVRLRGEEACKFQGYFFRIFALRVALEGKRKFF